MNFLDIIILAVLILFAVKGLVGVLSMKPRHLQG